MSRKVKFIRIPSKVIGKVDGMEILRPTEKSWDDYSDALQCFFNVGDTIMLLDKSKYTEEQLYTMTDKMKYEWMFKDKNYILAKVIERTNPYSLIVNAKNEKLCDNVHKINCAQGYAEGIVYETEDKRKINIYCAYYLMGGLVKK